MDLAQHLGVSFCWQDLGSDGIHQGMFNPCWRPSQRELADLPREYYRRYGNAPARGAGSGSSGSPRAPWKPSIDAVQTTIPSSST